MDCLDDMLSMPRDDDAEHRGRPTELKSCLIESEGGFPSNFELTGMTGAIQDTGLDDIKILRLHRAGSTFEFFLDISDKRFLVLHTNERSDDVRDVVHTLTTDRRHTFDHTWFSLQHVVRLYQEGW